MMRLKLEHHHLPTLTPQLSFLGLDPGFCFSQVPIWEWARWGIVHFPFEDLRYGLKVKQAPPQPKQDITVFSCS